MTDKYFSEWIIRLLILFFVVLPLATNVIVPVATNVIVPGIIQLTDCVVSEVEGFIAAQKVKRIQRESSAEWQEEVLTRVNEFKQRIEEYGELIKKDSSLRHDYLELIRFHNILVERVQIAKLRYAHGLQYSLSEKDLEKILPQKIVL